MAVASPEISASGSRKRSLTQDYETWIVREADCRKVPGARGSTALIFESAHKVRRVWVFPRNWYELDEESLWALSERAMRLSTRLDRSADTLSSALSASLGVIAEVEQRLARAKAAIADNRARQEERRKLLSRCRAERNRMREMVQAHVRELQRFGISAEDIGLYVASAARETIMQLSTSPDCARRLELDVDRWCAEAYRAA